MPLKKYCLWAAILVAGITISAIGYPNLSQADIQTEKPLPNGTLSEIQIQHRGQQLYVDLKGRFNTLQDNHDLPHTNKGRTDVSDIFAKYIPVGMPISDAEKILLAANANLADTPPRPARLNDPDYDRFDILGGITLSLGWFSNAHVGLKLQPSENGNPNATVKEVTGWIGVDVL
jgi:hypothetical protein